MADEDPGKGARTPMDEAIVRELTALRAEVTTGLAAIADAVRSSAAPRPDASPQPVMGTTASDAVDATGPGTAYEHEMAISRAIIAQGVDFIDLGCSTGGSLEYATRVLGMKRGIGVDLDPRKVSSTLASGQLAFVADAAELRLHGVTVPLVQGLHFLEHLPSVDVASAIVRNSIGWASEVVYFRQPYFDADDQLRDLGLKLYWSDWRGHPCHLKVADLHGVLADLKAEARITDFWVLGRGGITSSADASVHPLSAPSDQHAFDPELHGPKREVAFDFPVYRESVAVAILDPLARSSQSVLHALRACDRLAGSATFPVAEASRG